AAAPGWGGAAHPGRVCARSVASAGAPVAVGEAGAAVHETGRKDAGGSGPGVRDRPAGAWQLDAGALAVAAAVARKLPPRARSVSNDADAHAYAGGERPPARVEQQQ